jgi:ketosteroid isomerase-like protein
VSDADVVRRLYEAYRARDWPGFEMTLADDVRWTPGEVVIDDASTLVGPEAVRGHLQQLNEQFEGGLSVEVIELLGEDKDVTALVVFRGRGQTSGIEVALPLAQRYSLRDGRVVEFKQYASWEEGRAALG